MRNTIAGLCLFCAPLSATAQQVAAQLVIPIGHTEGITSVDVTADGRFYATGSLDRTVKIWDKNGHEIRTLVGHEMNVLSVAFSPSTPDDPGGGKHIVSCGSDRRAILWDKFGNKLASFSEPNAKWDMTAAAFAPDGLQMLVGQKDGTVRLLDLKCSELRLFKHKSEVSSVAFSPNGEHILVACADNTAYLWKKTDSARPVRALAGHTGAVLQAVFSQTGDTLLTASADRTAVLWKKDGSKIKAFAHDQQVRSAAFSYAKGYVGIATGSADGTLRIWAPDGSERRAYKPHRRGFSALKALPDASGFLSASDTEAAARLTRPTGAPSVQLRGFTSAITAMAISPDGSLLLVAHADSTAKLWDLSGQRIASFGYPDKLVSVAFSPKHQSDSIGGSQILVGCGDRSVRLQNKQGQVLAEFPNAVRGAFSPDGREVLTGNADGKTQIWVLNPPKGRLLPYTEQGIAALAFSPNINYQTFAVGSRNGTVALWDNPDAQPATVRLGSPTPVESMAFSADGKWLACGFKGGLTEVIDVGGKRVARSNRLRRLGNVGALAFLPKGEGANLSEKRLVRAAGNNLEIWATDEGQGVAFEGKGHISDITAIALSPTGNLVFSGSDDGTIKVWDVSSKKELATLVSVDATDWAVSTPQGLYDASSGAMSLMHYVAGMDVVLLRQIKERYLDPGLLSKVTGFNQDAVRDVPDLGDVALYPDLYAKINRNFLEISLEERSGGLGRLSLYINGKRIEQDINPDRLAKLPSIDLDQGKYAAHYRADTVNTIGLVAYNAGNWLRSQAHELTYQSVGSRGDGSVGPSLPSGADCRSARPQLYLIAVGTSKYADASKNLSYPDHDAAEMSKALSSVGKALFEAPNVHVKLLSTAGGGIEPSSKANIQAVFADVANGATPCDVLVVYLSGHGATWGADGVKSNFYYLTKDVSSERLRDDAVRKAFAISDAELEKWLTDVRAQKQVLIIDACHSGQAADNLNIGKKALNSSQAFAMNILNDRTGALILTGSLADMLSYEASKYGQGLLTYSLLNGMNGAGLKDGRFVDVMTLFQHARNEVPELAESIKQKQTPVIAGEGDSFPIGIKDNSVTIEIARAKPVFVQNKFMAIDSTGGFYRDTLGGIGLGKSLNNYFFDQKLKGAAAKYVFYDVGALPDAYWVEGVYTVYAQKLRINANLFKGGEPVGQPFVIETPKDIKAAMSQVLKEVVPRVPGG